MMPFPMSVAGEPQAQLHPDSRTRLPRWSASQLGKPSTGWIDRGVAYDVGQRVHRDLGGEEIGLDRFREPYLCACLHLC